MRVLAERASITAGEACSHADSSHARAQEVWGIPHASPWSCGWQMWPQGRPNAFCPLPSGASTASLTSEHLRVFAMMTVLVAMLLYTQQTTFTWGVGLQGCV